MELTLAERLLKLLHELPLTDDERHLEHTMDPGWRFLQVTVSHLALPEAEILQAGQELERRGDVQCLAGSLSSLKVLLRITRKGAERLQQLAAQEQREAQEKVEARKRRRLSKIESIKKYEAEAAFGTPKPPFVVSVEPGNKKRKVAKKRSKEKMRPSTKALITRTSDGEFLYGSKKIKLTSGPKEFFEHAFEENGKWVCSEAGIAWTENERQHFTTIRRALTAAGANPDFVFEVGRGKKGQAGRYRIKPERLSDSRQNRNASR